MSPNKKKKIRRRIDEAAAAIKDKLPPSSRHPSGRNAYAHIAKTVKSLYGKSYTALPDKEFKTIMEVIKYCEENPY